MKSHGTDGAVPDRHVLIVGYGNPLRGDDGVGCAITELLSSRPHTPGMQVIQTHQLTPELAEELSHADLAIFIDAACNVRPGEVATRQVVAQHPDPSRFCHHLTPQQLLYYAQSLYGSSPMAWTITVGGELWGFCEQLSPLVTSAIPHVLSQIDRLRHRAARATATAAVAVGGR
jgi:hydrogenase maturation protease